VMLIAAVGAILLVAGGGQRAFGIALAVVVAASLAWMLVSVFWPANPDRTCPSCGRPALRRSDPSTTRGVVCEACGVADPDRSSFLLAEAEDALIEPVEPRDRLPWRGPAS